MEDATKKDEAENSSAYSSSPVIFLLSLNMLVRCADYINNIYSWIPWTNFFSLRII